MLELRNLIIKIERKKERKRERNLIKENPSRLVAIILRPRQMYQLGNAFGGGEHFPQRKKLRRKLCNVRSNGLVTGRGRGETRLGHRNIPPPPHDILL